MGLADSFRRARRLERSPADALLVQPGPTSGTWHQLGHLGCPRLHPREDSTQAALWSFRYREQEQKTASPLLLLPPPLLACRAHWALPLVPPAKPTALLPLRPPTCTVYRNWLLTGSGANHLALAARA